MNMLYLTAGVLALLAGIFGIIRDVRRFNKTKEVARDTIWQYALELFGTGSWIYWAVLLILAGTLLVARGIVAA